MFERPERTATARCSSPSISARGDGRGAAGRARRRSPRRPAPNVAGIVTGATRRGPIRHCSPARGKVDEIAARRARSRRRPRHLRPRAVAARSSATSSARSSAASSTAPSLILDIFAQRARSAEGKLQVELAQLQHLSTRLVRGWTHLERQRGGIGLRGPGETQLETDRRLIGERVKVLQERLARVAQPARDAAPRARAAPRCAPSRWSATPMPASRRSSTA